MASTGVVTTFEISFIDFEGLARGVVGGDEDNLGILEVDWGKLVLGAGRISLIFKNK